jgi:CheY-like chemotaxis protein
MNNSRAILVVDDNPPMTKTLADILLTDVKMPDMNGVEFYQETCKTHPRLIAFLMTAYADDDIIQQGLEEGIETVFTKPVNIDFLLSLFSGASQ